MTNFLSPRANEPCCGDRIMLLAADGSPANKTTKVKSVISEDREEELWEVVDSFNQTRIITGYTEDIQWIEVAL